MCALPQVLRNERDSLRDRVKKTETEVDRVSTQSTLVLEQSRSDREQAQVRYSFM